MNWYKHYPTIKHSLQKAQNEAAEWAGNMWKLSAAEGNHRQDEVGATGEAPTREKQDITDVIISTNRLFTKHSDWKLTQFST